MFVVQPSCYRPLLAFVLLGCLVACGGKLPQGKVDGIPRWIPIYPGTEPALLVSSEDGDSESGTLFFSTDDPPEQVEAFFSTQLESFGFEPEVRPYDGPEGEGIQLVAEHARGHPGLTLTLNSTTDGTECVLNYIQKI